MATGVTAQTGKPDRHYFLPILNCLLAYERAWLLGDVLAGLLSNLLIGPPSAPE